MQTKGTFLTIYIFFIVLYFFTTNQLTIQTVFFFSLSSPFLILVLLMPSFSSDDHQKTATKYFIHIRLAIRIQHDVSLYYIILCSYLTYKISYKSHHFFWLQIEYIFFLSWRWNVLNQIGHLKSYLSVIVALVKHV